MLSHPPTSLELTDASERREAQEHLYRLWHIMGLHRGICGIVLPEDLPPHKKEIYRALWVALGHTLLGDDLQYGEELT